MKLKLLEPKISDLLIKDVKFLSEFWRIIAPNDKLNRQMTHL